MAAGATSVQIAASGSAADIKTALDAAITATNVDIEAMGMCQINNGTVIVAVISGA